MSFLIRRYLNPGGIGPITLQRRANLFHVRGTLQADSWKQSAASRCWIQRSRLSVGLKKRAICCSIWRRSPDDNRE